jgi:hypothetical protein
MSVVEAMVFATGLLIVLLVAAWVAAPLFGAPERMDPAAEPSARDRWEREKRQALAAIKETELDFEMGKLSEEDYARMRARFEARALEAMEALDRSPGRA